MSVHFNKQKTLLGLLRAELALLGLWSGPNIFDDVSRSGWPQQWIICQHEAWVEVVYQLSSEWHGLEGLQARGNQSPSGAGSADVHGRHH